MQFFNFILKTFEISQRLLRGRVVIWFIVKSFFNYNAYKFTFVMYHRFPPPKLLQIKCKISWMKWIDSLLVKKEKATFIQTHLVAVFLKVTSLNHNYHETVYINPMQISPKKRIHRKFIKCQQNVCQASKIR